MQIRGSTILVTGASSGIGAALAPLLAARGATVGIVARRRERLEEVLAACRHHAPASRLWAADLGDLERAEAVAREAWDAFGGLDVLVNNAAIPKRMPVPRLTAADIAHVMDVNFHSPVRMGHALLPPGHDADGGPAGGEQRGEGGADPRGRAGDENLRAANPHARALLRVRARWEGHA